MYKTIRKIIKRTTNRGTTVSVYDSLLNRMRKTLMNMIFGVALANKITPKKLANSMLSEKTEKFAEEFSKELTNKAKKEQEKTQKKLDNIFKEKSSKKACN